MNMPSFFDSDIAKNGVTVSLAGAHYRPAETQGAWRFLEPGDELFLKPDPENVFDKHAVKVIAFIPTGADDTSEYFFGFVPRTHSKDIALFLADPTKQVTATKAGHSTLTIYVERVEAPSAEGSAV